MIINILLILLAIILVIGIIRVIMEPAKGFIDFLMHIMLIDWLSDILVAIIESIGGDI